MSKERYTYRIGRAAFSILLWELIFWFTLLVGREIVSKSLGGNKQIIFLEPRYLYLLILLIPIIGVSLFQLLKYNQLVERTSLNVRKSLFSSINTGRFLIKFILFRTSLVFLIIALAQPSFGKKKVSGLSKELELVVCLDISNSMNTQDISPTMSRLQVSKRALSQLINQLSGEQIGLCLFANSAFVQLPVTRDYSAAKLFLSDIETSMISGQGTNINAALETALSMFSEKQIPKAILVITDGENHEESPDEVLKKIRDQKIGLSLLGIGTRNGGMIPKDPDRPERGYKTTASGVRIISKVNPAFIRKLASLGGGSAHLSESEFPDLTQILTEINLSKRTKSDNFEFEISQERYQIPLFLAICCWVAFLGFHGRSRLFVVAKKKK